MCKGFPKEGKAGNPVAEGKNPLGKKLAGLGKLEGKEWKEGHLGLCVVDPLLFVLTPLVDGIVGLG